MSNSLLDPSPANDRAPINPGGDRMTPPRKPQVRLRFSKLGKVRFTSHRDMARMWERAVRRANLPIAYSEGFSPRAKLSFGLALPTVFESMAEYVDLTLDEQVELDGLDIALTEALPVGIDVNGLIALEGKVDSLQECVESTEWSLFVDGELADWQDWAAGVLTADELPITRERKGKSRTDDVRPAITRVEILAADDPSAPSASVEVRAQLAAKPRALRPLELLDIHEPAGTLVLGRRIHQFIAPVGARLDPLEVGAAEVPHSLSCAS